MGRRNDHSREEIQDMAINAASALACAGGLHAVTARAVASQIGYAPGTLYNIFGNLDGLVLAVNGRTLAKLEHALEEAAPMTGDPDVDLEAMLSCYADAIEQAPNLWALLNTHSLPEGHAAPDWYQNRIDSLLERVETALLPIFAKHPNAAQHASEAARLLWLAVHGLLSGLDARTISSVSAQDARSLTKSLLFTYLAGIRAQLENP